MSEDQNLYELAREIWPDVDWGKQPDDENDLVEGRTANGLVTVVLFRNEAAFSCTVFLTRMSYMTSSFRITTRKTSLATLLVAKNDFNANIQNIAGYFAEQCRQKQAAAQRSAQHLTYCQDVILALNGEIRDGKHKKDQDRVDAGTASPKT